MDMIKFSETAFSDNNKKGILKPDSNGYYSVILGALNMYNSANEFYTAEGALQLFDASSHFMRMIKGGSLYSEVGHPKKDPSTSMEYFYTRIMQIDEKNVCGHISDVSLNFNFGKEHLEINSPDAIAIVGKVKPFGPQSETLKVSLETEAINTSFSVRGLTENKYKNGRTERTLTQIITWDFVYMPGIKIATKANAPGLESYELEELNDTIVDKKLLKKVLSNNLTNIAMEANKEYYKELIFKLDIDTTINKLAKW